MPAYVGRLSAHERTHSPSGRFHPDPVRRREIRQADITANIDYYAPHGAPFAAIWSTQDDPGRSGHLKALLRTAT